MAAGIAITYRLLESAYRCETHTDEQALVGDVPARVELEN